MSIVRNNIRISLNIPSYANVTIYWLGAHLSVTFPIKKELIDYINKVADYDTLRFQRGNRYYISRTVYIPFSETTEQDTLENLIRKKANEMRLQLMIIRRHAEIDYLRDEKTLLISEFDNLQ